MPEVESESTNAMLSASPVVVHERRALLSAHRISAKLVSRDLECRSEKLRGMIALKRAAHMSARSRFRLVPVRSQKKADAFRDLLGLIEIVVSSPGPPARPAVPASMRLQRMPRRRGPLPRCNPEGQRYLLRPAPKPISEKG